MELEYPPEPWIIKIDPERYSSQGECYSIQTEDMLNSEDGIILDTECDQNCYPDIETARRICACVNACKGMSTEGLTKLVEHGGRIISRSAGRTILYCPLSHEPGAE